MTTRTWIGGGNNSAHNPKDWSPGGSPQAGDTLTMSSGTIVVHGQDLAGDTLNVPAFHTVNIETRANADLNLAGRGVIDIDVHGTVNLKALVAGQVHVHGGTIHFAGDSTFSGVGSTLLEGRLTGHATINLSGAQGEGQAMEVDGPVSSALTFKYTTLAPVAGLQIDHPETFHALVELPPPTGLEYLQLMGLHATSGTLRGETLTLYDGCQAVDRIRLSGGSNLQLQQNSAGVMISEGYGRYVEGGTGTPIPLHVV